MDELRISKGVARWTSNFTPPSGPYTADPTKLLLHMDGPDGSTVFTDSSPSPKTVTANGNAQVDTAQAQFGGASGLFDGNGDYLTVPDSDDWNFGSGDFTMDFRVKFNALPALNNAAWLVSQWGGAPTSEWFVYLDRNGDDQRFWKLECYNGSLVVSIVAQTTVTANTWYHIAITKESGLYRIFQNGVELVQTFDSDPLPDFGGDLIIGRRGDSAFPLNGWLEEVCVTKGVARWTSDFTPPSAPYPQYAIFTVPAFGSTNVTISVTPSVAGVLTNSVVLASNGGSATNTLVATAGDVAPLILAEPVSQTVAVGSTASLTVTAGGALPLAYQWRKNGVNLAGFTNYDLRITNASLADAANYDVIVTNSYGSVTSTVAALSVSLNGLDTAFGAGGKVTTAVGAGDDIAYGVALQSDGKIVVAGDSHNGSNADMAAVRYNADGSFDTSFGSGGKITTDFGLGEDHGYGVALQSDGKIIVAGASNNDFAVVRYNSNGSLDTSFGSGGKVTTDFGSSDDKGLGVVLQSDGKIIVVGRSNLSGNHDFALVRYNFNGSLDAGFGSGGKVITSIGSGTDVCASVALQGDGKIVMAGYSDNGGNVDFALARYNSDGSLDASFGTGGKVTTAIGTSEDAGFSVVVQGDGKIVVGGESHNGSDYDFALVRYNSDGSLDTGFNGNGKATADFGSGHDSGLSIALRGDGKIVVAGYSWNGSNNDFAVARWNADGSLDAGFGTGGKLTTAIGSGDDYGRSVAVRGDGGIVVAGSSHNGSNYDFALVRYLGTVSPPPTITVQPQSVAVALGGTANLSVTAIGQAPLSYQWRKNGTAIPNATNSSLSILSSSVADAGNYDVIVSNSYGSVTSAVAALSVVPTPPPNMVLIPPGEFTMGDTFAEGDADERPTHTVNVTAFYMDQYEVTKVLWDEVYQWALTSGYSFDNAGSGKAANHPVQTVSWYDAVKWCNARSQKEGKPPAYYADAGLTQVYKTGQVAPYVNWAAGYRLPTEAEWEKAARGGQSGKRFPWADADTITHSRANYNAVNSYSYDLSYPAGYHPTYATGGVPYTSLVGSFAGNGYGLYDMAGNVWEWCWDRYGDSYYSSSPASDPRGPGSGSTRVACGGGWQADAVGSRVTDRGAGTPTGGALDGGFRSILPLPSAPTITVIANQTINEDSNTGALAFTIGDAETAATSLTLTKSSSNQAFVPDANIVFGGSGASRTVTVTPAANANGSATVTVTVTDGDGLTASDTFTVTVSAVNDAPTFVALGGSVSFSENGSAVRLDANANMQDAELNAANNFGGATLTLARNGGASAQDVFGFASPVTVVGGDLQISGVVKASFTQSGGTLTVTFNSGATGVDADNLLQSLTYSISSEAPPASVVVDFTFNDGNSGSQGTGGALTATGSVTVNITLVNDAPMGANNTVTTLEDTAYSFSAADFGFTDPNDSPANAFSRVKITTLPSAGALTVNGTAVNAGDFVPPNAILAGTTWTARESNRAWQSVASSADGSKLVAGDYGNRIYTSTDSGVSWTPRDSNRAWRAIASSADGSKLVAVVFSGQIYTSTDSGMSWTAQNSGSRSWKSVASSDDGTKLVAVVNGGQIYTSTDSGVSWTARESSREWYSVASSADGTKLVAVVRVGQIYTSTDSGVSWTARASSKYWYSVASSADGSKLVAGGEASQIYTSTDSGVNWTARATGRDWESFASSADGSKLIACVWPGQIYTSTDSGVSWMARESSRQWASVASSADGNKLVATDYGGQIYTSAASAALVFTPVTNANGAPYASFTFQVEDDGGTANGGVNLDPTPRTMTVNVTGLNNAPAGANNTVTTMEDSGYTFSAADFGFSDPNDSPANAFSRVKITTLPAAGTLTLDGTPVNAGDFVPPNGIAVDTGATWTARESSRSWRAVASSADGNKLVAVDNTPGQIYTSTDAGVSWTAQNSGSRGWLSVASSADSSKLIAGTGNGKLYTSTDSGVNWTARENNRSWLSVASSSDGGKLVAVAAGGQIYTSTDSGVSWTARATSRSWFGIASSADGSKLIAVVYNGQIYTSTDSGVNWTARESSRSWLSVASSADGSKLVAVVENGRIYTSTDSGVNWTARESSRTWLFVASSADGSKLVAVVIGGQIYTSTDSGVSWTARESGREWRGVASSADGSKLVAVVDGGQIYTSAASAPLVFTPGTNANGTPYTAFTFQVEDDGGTANGGVNLDPTPRTMTVNVTSVNDAPSFVKGTDQIVPQNSGAQSVTGWATTISAGLADESGQAVNFIVSNDNNALFSVQPAVSVTGTLTYTPAASASGSAVVSVQLHDDGGTANGGVDTSAVQTFLITVQVPPTINSQPRTQSLLSGHNLILGAALNGSGPFAYQWRFNGTPIAGQTNALLFLPMVTNANGGNYDLIASNYVGAVTSAVAAVTVNAMPSPRVVVAWGRNDFGQTTVPAGLNDVVAVAAGWYHTLALRSDGTVVAWVRNDFGLSTVPSGLSGVVAVAAGNLHNLALKGDGTAVAWGANDFGQTNVPLDLSGAVAVAAGESFSLALKTDGTVVAWGWNGYAQTAVPVGLSGVVALAAGYGHSLALKSDGTVVAWGSNSNGESVVPVALSGVVAVAASGEHSLALKSDGTVVAWGYNGNGQTNVPAGLSGVVAVSAGRYHSLALKSDGTMVAWGFNFYGQTNVPTGLSGVVAMAGGGYHNLVLMSGPPVIITQPASQTVVAGGNVTLSVLAGGPQLALQWRKNGANLVGQTNPQLSTLNTQLSDVGNYDVIVSNAYGSITSAVAAVSVSLNGLDTTFGTGGKVTTGIGTGDDEGHDVVIQADGKIVVAGYSHNGSNYDFALVRFNADGSLDPSFGSGGKVTTAFGSGDDLAYGVALQSDGKIVVAGGSHNGADWDFALARYNSDGSLDPTFDSDGRVTTAMSGNGTSVAVQSDGKIVVGGLSEAGTRDFALVRYNSDGSLDTTFNGTGKVTTDFGSTTDSGADVALQSDGKIVLAGSVWNGSTTLFALARYNSNGSLDTMFDSDGRVATTVLGNDTGNSVAVQGDGRIVVTGWTNPRDFALVRYNADGSLDTTFDSDGKVTTDVGPGPDDARGVAVQADGRIVVVGAANNENNLGGFGVVRYNTDGSLDTNFGAGGKVTTDVGPGRDEALRVAFQADGGIVVAGWSFNGSNNDIAVVRYLGGTISPVPPTIVTPPQSQVVAVGANASFNVVATGPLLSYQWRSNGVSVANATNATLTLTNLSLAANGSQYSVVVTNDYGSVTSAVATLYFGTVVTSASPTGTWTAANSPYNVTNSITIADLTIQPGVTVLANPGAELKVTGRLQALGAAGNEIVFRPGVGTNGWAGLFFQNADAASRLEFCRVEGATNSGVRVQGVPLTFRSCVFTNNAGSLGGGVRSDSDLTLENCVIAGNLVRVINNIAVTNCRGGGVYGGGGTLTLIGCTVVSNLVDAASLDNGSAYAYGGGIYAGGTRLVLRDTLLQGNRLRAFGGIMTFGGGLPDKPTASGAGVYATGTLLATNTVLFGNVASGGGYASGGAIWASGASTLAGCMVRSNRAEMVEFFGYSARGGGVYVSGVPTLTLLNSLFAGNIAYSATAAVNHFGGAVSGGTGLIENCTVVNNAPDGVDNFAGTLRNSIVYGNTTVQINGGTPTVTYSDVQGGFTGTGNVDAAPLFLNASNYVTSASSPAVDAGDPATAFNDLHFPPSQGTARNDLGAYGGPGANVWSASLAGQAAPLALANQGTGSITINPQQSTYFLGQPVTLTPVAGRYYAFSQWSDGNTQNPRTITIGASNYFSAIFTNTVPLEWQVLQQWDKSFGGTARESGTVIATPDGGVLLSGDSSSGADGNKSTTGFGGSDAWLVRLDKDGAKIWEKVFGGTGDDGGSVVATIDGGFLVVCNSTSGASGNRTIASQGGRDVWLIKLNADGNKQWEAVLGGTGDDSGGPVVPLPDGGFLLGGASDSPISGSKGVGGYGSQDVWLVRLDGMGNKLWEKVFGGTGMDYTIGLSPMADGGFVLLALSQSAASGNKQSPGYGIDDFWVLRLSADGDKQWEQTYGGSGFDTPHSMLPLSDGTVLLMGGSYSIPSGNKTANPIGDRDFWVVKIDAAGGILWDRTYGGTGDDVPINALRTLNGSLLLSGMSASGISGNKTLAGFGGGDFWLVEIDSDGGLKRQAVFGGAAWDHPYGFVATSDSGLVVAGESASPPSGNKTSPTYGNTDLWAIKFNIFEFPVGTPQILVNGAFNPGGTFTFAAPTNVTVTLSSSYAGGLVLYTTDGSDPFGGNIYTGPFSVSSTVTVRVLALKSDLTEPVEADPVVIRILPVYTLTDTTPGGGSVAFSPAGGSYLDSTVVTNTAAVSNGWSFVRWEVTSDGVTTAYTNNPVPITLTTNKTVKAVFGTGLTASAIGNGAIQKYPASGPYPYGQPVRLSAVPNAGAYFRFWGGALAGQTISPLELTVTNANPTVSAVFANLTGSDRALTVLVNGSGTVAKNPQQEKYADGSSVTLTAAAGPGQFFQGWSGDASGADNPLTLVMNASKTVTATFGAQVVSVLSIGNATVPEGNTGAGDALFTVALSAANPQPVAVDFFTVDGTATAGSDYVATSGTLTFTPGETSKTIAVSVLGDRLIEPTEMFRVVLANPANATISASQGEGTGTVQHDDAAPPGFTAQPLNQNVNQGTTAVFAAPTGGPVPQTFLWKKGGVSMANDGRISGATTTTLTINNAQPADEGSYQLEASNANGTTNSAVATLTVNRPPTISPQPQSLTVIQGSNAVFTVGASGSGTLSYQWRKGGAPILNATNTQLSTLNVQLPDEGSYDVVVTNFVAGVTSQVATLTVHVPPFITAQPQSRTNVAGTTATFTVTGGGTPAPGYQWYKSVVSGQWSVVSGATADQLSLSNAQASDAGDYRVVLTNLMVGNVAGSVTSLVAALTVNVPPAISPQPQSLTVIQGSNAVFTVGASGSGTLYYQWRKGGVALIGQTGTTLTFNSVQPSDEGAYDVVVTNFVAGVTSQVATLTVHVPPFITTPPQSQTVFAGSNVTFSVTGGSTPAPNYQWFKDGTPLVGQTGAGLLLNNVQSSDAGTYRVVLTNLMAGGVGGATNASATLTVIVKVPINVTVLGAGVVSKAPDKAQYDPNELVTLTATPARYYAFDHWISNGVATVNATNYAITVGMVNDYTAIFTNIVELETNAFGVVQPVGTPLITVNDTYQPSGSYLFGDAAQVKIASSFPNGTIAYTTNGADPDLAGVSYSGPFVVTNSVVVRTVAYSSDFSLRRFADPVNLTVLPTYHLTNLLSGGGSVLVDPPMGPVASNAAAVVWGPYFSNSTATIAAVPSNNWFFLHWTNDAAGTNSPAGVVLNGPRTVRAVFGAPVGMSIFGPGSLVSKPNLDRHPYGSTVRITAVPQAGNYFRFWGGAASGNSVSPLNFTLTNAPVTVSALFGALPNATNVALTIIEEGGGAVAVSPQKNYYNLNEGVTLTANPEPGYVFTRWSGGATGSQNPLLLTMSSSLVITGHFVFNTAPSVAFTNLAASNFFRIGEPIALGAEASDAETGVTNVSFYVGETLLKSFAGPPYLFVWTNAPLGVNQLVTARAVDTVGTMATSTPVAVTVAAYAPEIVQQPQDVAVLAGGSVVFNVGVTGTPPFGFQWHKSVVSGQWLVVNGATNFQLSTFNTQPSDAGSYQVVVTNFGGSVTSRVAQLRVITLDNIREDFWVTDGPVRAVAVSNGVVYAGGEFQHVAPVAGGVALTDGASGTVRQPFPRVNGEVFAVVADGAGGWFLGGNFTHVSGQARNHLAHVLADGTVDPAWQPAANGSVNAMALANGRLYVGGGFTGIDGSIRNRAAALHATSGAVLGWNPNANSIVNALAVSGDGNAVYAGGDFTQIGGASRQRLAKLETADPGNAATGWTADADNSVFALVVTNGSVYVGGGFQQMGTQARSRLARVSESSPATVSSWNPQAGQRVRALAVSGDRLLVGGEFLNMGAAFEARPYLAAVALTDGSLSAWQPNPNGTVWSLAVAGDVVYVGGDFSVMDGAGRNGAAAVSATASVAGSYTTAWNPKAGPRATGGGYTVRALGAHAGNVAVGGSFVVVGREPRSNLAAFDGVSGAVLAGWNPGANNTVETLALGHGVVYAGGQFTQAGGQTRNRIAALDPMNGTATGWNPNADGQVYAILPAGNTVYVGGTFGNVGGVARSRLAALDAASGQATPWTAAILGPRVNTLGLDGTTLYVGGNFSQVGGIARTHLAAVSVTANSDNVLAGWNPGPNQEVETLAMRPGLVYVGGLFTQIGGQSRSFVAAVNAAGAATSWAPNANGSVTALAVADGIIYAGGQFSNIGRQARSNFALLDDGSGDALMFNPGASHLVHSLAVEAGTVYLGGEFSALGGRAVGRLGVMGADGSPVVIGQESDQTVNQASSLILHALVLGKGPLFYQWQHAGTNLAGATAATLVLTNMDTNHTGLYSVVVSNQLGVITNEVSRLTVNPGLTVALSGATLAAPGSAVVFTARATGAEPITLEWRLNGQPIFTNAVTNLFISNNVAVSTLTVRNAQPTNSGSYLVTVRNAFGAADSEVIRLVVTEAGNYLSLADNFASRPAISGTGGYVVGHNAGATVELPLEPQHAGRPGGASVWVKWVAPDNGVATFSTAGSGLDTLLAIYTTNNPSDMSLGGLRRVASDDDQGGFGTSRASFNATNGVEYAVAIDGFGGATNHIVLSWNLESVNDDVPVIVDQPKSKTVTNELETVTFRVEARNREGNTNNITYQWRHHGEEIPGATNATLTIQVSSAVQNPYASYVCDVFIGGRKDRTYPAVLERNATRRNGVDESSASARSQDKFDEVFETVEATLPGGKRTGRRAAGAGGFGLIVGAGTIGTQVLGNIGSTRELFEPIVGGTGMGASRWFALQAQSSGTMIVDTEGSEADTVMAVYLGSSLTALTPVASDSRSAPDGTNALVSFPTVAGQSYLIAVDSENGKTGLIKLNFRMGQPVEIQQHPVSTNVNRLENAVFSVVASGVPAPAYQWRHNGTDLPSQTNATLTLTNVALSDAGSYSVIVSNLLNVAVSGAAQLTVTDVKSWFEPPTLLSGTGLRLQGFSPMGKRVVIRASTNIADALSLWVPVYTNNDGTGTFSFTNSDLTLYPRRFFLAVPDP